MPTQQVNIKRRRKIIINSNLKNCKKLLNFFAMPIFRRQYIILSIHCRRSSRWVAKPRYKCTKSTASIEHLNPFNTTSVVMRLLKVIDSTGCRFHRFFNWATGRVNKSTKYFCICYRFLHWVFGFWRHKTCVCISYV